MTQLVELGLNTSYAIFDNLFLPRSLETIASTIPEMGHEWMISGGVLLAAGSYWLYRQISNAQAYQVERARLIANIHHLGIRDQYRNFDSSTLINTAPFGSGTPLPFRDDAEVAREVLQFDGAALEYFSERLRGDRELVLLAVARCGYALRYATDELRQDEEIARVAIRQNPNAQYYAFLPSHVIQNILDSQPLNVIQNNNPPLIPLFQPNAGMTFCVRVSDLKENPKEVLLQWANLPNPPGKIEFLDDNNHPYPGVDRGGPTKQFYSDLLKNLFLDNVLFSIDDEGLPACTTYGSKMKELLPKLGKILAFIRDQNLITGPVVSSKFFAILQIARQPLDNSLKQEMIGRLLNKPYIQAMQNWLAGDASKDKIVFKYLQKAHAGEEYYPTKEEMIEEAKELVRDVANSYLLVAEGLLENPSFNITLARLCNF